jgi:hypothetical protein
MVFGPRDRGVKGVMVKGGKAPFVPRGTGIWHAFLGGARVFLEFGSEARMAAKRPEIVVNEGRLGGIRTRMLS